MAAEELTSAITASAVTVRQLHAADGPAWDQYVRTHAEATFFHLVGWRDVLDRAFGHASYYFLAESEGKIAGVLPLARVKHRLFGDALISTPFCVYGGALGEDEKVLTALEDVACTLADDLGVDYLELRNRSRRRPGWPCKNLYVTFRKQLKLDVEQNFLAIPKKQRAMVRKGIQAGLTSKSGDDISTLFRCYSESVRNLGTPVFSRKYFEILKEVFNDDCDVLTAYHGEIPIASVMSFYFHDEVLPYYGGGSVQARQLKANDFLYWELMRRAVSNGLNMFDYGRSKVDTGSYRFKKHWGFSPEPLYYEYYLVRAQNMPDVSPNNPKYQLMINIWKRLPLWISNRLGPLVSGYLG